MHVKKVVCGILVYVLLKVINIEIVIRKNYVDNLILTYMKH